MLPPHFPGELHPKRHTQGAAVQVSTSVQPLRDGSRVANVSQVDIVRREKDVVNGLSS